MNHFSASQPICEDREREREREREFRELGSMLQPIWVREKEREREKEKKREGEREVWELCVSFDFPLGVIESETGEKYKEKKK